jgi:hypothetical protein
MLKIKIILLSIFFSLSQVESLAAVKNPFPLCGDILAKHWVLDESEKILFVSNSGARFEAILNNAGLLKFDVHNLGLNNERLDEDFNPKAALLNVIKHWGDRVQVIRGVWMKVHGEAPENQSRNYYEFMAALEKGLKPEDAVFETWTGKQARAAGFSKCSNIIYISDTDENPKSAWKLFVDFVR